MSCAGIAEAKGVKPMTIQSNLGGGSKQELVVWAVRNGLLDD